MRRLKKLLQVRNSTITLYSDHMAKKFHIKLPKYSKRNFKLCANFKILLGGHYNSKYNQTKYYLTTELYGENSNTTASQLHYVIKDLMKQEVSEVYFILDNHSTNKNMVVFAYLDFLVHFPFFIIDSDN